LCRHTSLSFLSAAVFLYFFLLVCIGASKSRVPSKPIYSTKFNKCLFFSRFFPKSIFLKFDQLSGKLWQYLWHEISILWNYVPACM
jgi:hypothetical protein